MRHHRSLGEAAEHNALREDAGLGERRLEPCGDLGEGRQERVGIRESDLPHRVPVRAAGWECQRASREEPDQALLRVEEVEEGQEVELVGAASVEQDESAGRLTSRRSGAMHDRARLGLHEMSLGERP